MRVRYNGRNVCGFENGNEYEVEVTKQPKEYTCLVKASYNYSKEDECKISMRLSGRKSVEKNFVDIELEHKN